MHAQKPVHVTRATELTTSGAQTDGMIRQAAITNVTPSLCASLMIAHAQTASAVHHHGAQDTIVYAVSGHGSIVSNGGRRTQRLDPGDFALIPAWAEHQEVNTGDADCVWVITRSGAEPVVVNLEGWGQSLDGDGEAEAEGGAK